MEPFLPRGPFVAGAWRGCFLGGGVTRCRLVGGESLSEQSSSSSSSSSLRVRLARFSDARKLGRALLIARLSNSYWRWAGVSQVEKRGGTGLEQFLIAQTIPRWACTWQNRSYCLSSGILQLCSEQHGCPTVTPSVTAAVMRAINEVRYDIFSMKFTHLVLHLVQEQSSYRDRRHGPTSLVQFLPFRHFERGGLH